VNDSSLAAGDYWSSRYNAVIPGMSANLHWKCDERFIADADTARDTQQLTHVYNNNNNNKYRYTCYLHSGIIAKGIFVLCTLAVYIYIYIWPYIGTHKPNRVRIVIFLHTYIISSDVIHRELTCSFPSCCFRRLKNLPVALTYYNVHNYNTFCLR